MANESLIIVILVGIVAGWLAGQIVQGVGFGIVGDLIVGVIGAFIGFRFLPELNIHLGTGLVGEVVNATLGAILLLVLIKLIRGGGRVGSGWRLRR